jgi:hypothetical protein
MNEKKEIFVEMMHASEPVTGIILRRDGTLALLAGGRGLAIKLEAVDLGLLPIERQVLRTIAAHLEIDARRRCMEAEAPSVGVADDDR